MTFFDKTKDAAGKAGDAAASIGSTAKRQARRAQLEIEARRLEARVNREFAVIGKALYPALEAGTLEATPEMESAMVSLKGLLASLDAARTELEQAGGHLPIGEPTFTGDED